MESVIDRGTTRRGSSDRRNQSDCEDQRTNDGGCPDDVASVTLGRGSVWVVVESGSVDGFVVSSRRLGFVIEVRTAVDRAHVIRPFDFRTSSVTSCFLYTTIVSCILYRVKEIICNCGFAHSERPTGTFRQPGSGCRIGARMSSFEHLGGVRRTRSDESGAEGDAKGDRPDRGNFGDSRKDVGPDLCQP